MLLNCSIQKLIKMENSADFSMNSSSRCPSSKQQAMQWEEMNAKNGGVNLWARAPLRRTLAFQIVAVFGAVLCSPLLVDGLARAGEKRSYLRFDPRDVSSDDVVLQGFPYTVSLQRPSTSAWLRLKDDEMEEVLSVKLKLLRSKASAFLVFINLPDANDQTPITCPEFSGSYFHEPRRVKSPDFEFQVTSFRIGISDIIKDLGLWENPSVLVTFVPCGIDKGLPVVLESVGIDLE